jgi:hypothetical protein
MYVCMYTYIYLKVVHMLSDGYMESYKLCKLFDRSNDNRESGHDVLHARAVPRRGADVGVRGAAQRGQILAHERHHGPQGRLRVQDSRTH